MPDSPHSVDATAWAENLAAHLRFLQADLSDVPQERREPIIEAEVRRALRVVAAELQPRFLATLKEEFPTFVFGDAPVIAVPDEPTPEALVEALVRIAPRLHPQTIAELGVQLQAAGYLGSRSTTLTSDAPPELTSLFGLGEGQPIDVQRLYLLATAFISSWLDIDHLAAEVWRQVDSSGRLRRESGERGNVRLLAKRFLTRDGDVSSEQVGALLDRTRRLTAGLLSAMGKASRVFAQRFAADYLPDHIFEAARTDRSVKGWFREVRAWRKFKSLFEAQTEEATEMRFREAIALSAEEMMHGLRR